MAKMTEIVRIISILLGLALPLHASASEFTVPTDLETRRHIKHSGNEKYAALIEASA